MIAHEIRRLIEKELNKILDIKDIDQRFEAFKGIIDLYIDLELISFFTTLLSNYREFNFQEFIDAAIDVRDFITLTVSRNSVSVDFDKERLKSKLKSDFVRWKEAVKELRDLLGVSYDHPIKNSHFVRILFERNDEYFVTYPKLALSGKSLGFLWIILHGNLNVDWGDVEYGGFSPVKYGGVDFITDLEVILKERLSGTILKDLQKLLTDYIIVVNKTRFVNSLLDDADREIVEILNKAASYILSNRPLTGLFIEVRGTIYELIQTKSGKLGVRYSLKYNRKTRNWETNEE